MLDRWRALALLATVPATLAQTHAFGWTFANLTAGSKTISQCGFLRVELSPPNASVTATGTAPWTMLAFEGGKSPTSQVLGTDKSSLVWQVRHAPGAELLITIVDGSGNYGGFPDVMYTVEAGSSASCMPSTGSSTFSVTSNVTSSLSTCASWGLTVNGGTPPYSISLAALGASVVTNVTGAAADNRFTYINRAAPQTPLIAGVIDSTGQWGISSALITTTGASDVTCAGLQSSWDDVPITSSASSNAASSTSVSASSASAIPASTSPSTSSKSTSNAGPIAGGVVGGLAVLALLGAFLCLWRRRQRRRTVRPYDHSRTDSGGLFDTEKAGEAALAPSSLPRGHAMLVPTPYLPGSTQDTGAAPAPASPKSVQDGSTGSGPAASSTITSSENAPGPFAGLSPLRAARKAREAQEAAATARQREALASASPAAAATVSAQGLTSAPGEPDTIVVQHRDGGVPDPVVLELPPAYADHRQRNSKGGRS